MVSLQGLVYAGSWDSQLYALDQLSGNITWNLQTGWGIQTTPVIENETLFVGSHDHNLYAVNKNTGEMLWVFSCKAAIHTNPVIWQDSVLIGSDDGRLYRLDKQTGEHIWAFAPGNTIHQASRNYKTTAIRSTFDVNEGQVIIGVLGSLYSLR